MLQVTQPTNILVTAPPTLSLTSDPLNLLSQGSQAKIAVKAKHLKTGWDNN